MTMRPPPFITAGTLLSALLIFTPNTTAQTSSPTLTTLATFTSAPSDGIGPLGVVAGSGGVLYGVTQSGGAAGSGTVFSLTPPASSGGAWTEAVIYNFTGGSDGGSPTGVVIGSGGVLYGTTTYGGSGCDLFLFNGGCGAVFSLTPPASGPFGPGRTWTESVLYSFAGASDGSGPTAGVVIGSGGVLYGTTSAVGTGNHSTVFSLTPPASASGSWTEQVLYSFPANVSNYYGNSFSPNGVVIGSGGVLYGVTQYGGAGTNRPCNFPPGGCGTVYSLTPPKSPGGAWTAATLYSFSGSSDGAFPAGVVIGGGGVLYGATQLGGPANNGLVFSLTPQSGTGAWNETVLYSGGSTAGVAIGAGGVLYAVIQHFPGSSPYAVVSLTPPMGATSGSGGSWTASTLYTFSIPGGAQPVSALVIGSAGVLYGATVNGGTATAGTIYSVTPPTASSGAWTGSVLYSFTGGSPGSVALTNLASGSNGVLYGVTTGGGTGSCPIGCGTVFSLTPPASAGGAWTESLLYRFTGGSDGAYPKAGVAIGSGGVLYGTTYVGGSGPCTLYGYPPGCGTVFSLTPPASPGGAWTEAVLHSFTIPNSVCDLPLCPGGSDGAYPNTGLVIGSGGVLYGTTQAGGTGPCNFGCGTAFQLAPPMSPGGAWTEAVLYSFTGNPYALGLGAGPSGLGIGSGGVLYGTTQFTGNSPFDGQPGCGTIFTLTPPTGTPSASGGAWTETLLYNFSGNSSDGCTPNTGVVIGGGGVLYGTTLYSGTGYGAVFSLTPPASSGGDWTEAVIHDFTEVDGDIPNGVTIGSGGVLYGTTQHGGSGPCTPNGFYPGCGTVFALIPPVPADGAWVDATIYNFTNGSDGAFPNTGVVIGSGGVLYGTTQASANTATVFSLNVGNGLLPSINPGGVVNAASYTALVVPGSIASAFGDFLLSSPLSATQSPLPTDLSDLSLQFGDAALAPLFFVSGGQVNFQVPWEVAGSTTLTATVNGQTGATQAVALAPFAPAIFSTNAEGSGQGAILDASNHLVNASNPATSGSTVQIFCTGLGGVTSQPPTGSPAPLTSLVRTLTTPTATIGGLPANVSFSGLAPGYVGLYQVNVQVPTGLAANNAAPVVLYIGGTTSNTVTMAVQ